MTEIGLILGVNIGSIGFAAALMHRACVGVSWAGKDAGQAVARTVVAFSRRSLRQTAALLGTGACIVWLARWQMTRGDGTFLLAGLTAGGTLLGGILGLAGARLSVLASLKASRQRVAGIAGPPIASMTKSLHSATGIALCATAVAELGAILVAATVVGRPIQAAFDPKVAVELTAALSGYALGSVLVAFAVQRGGASFRTAIDAAHASAELIDPIGPTQSTGVARMAAQHLDGVASRVAGIQGYSATVTLAALLVCRAVSEHAGATLGVDLFFLLYVIRSLGIIGSCYGLFASRAENAVSVFAGIARGHAATSIITLGGVAGACFWLASSESWLLLFGAGTLGLMGVSVCSHSAGYGLTRSPLPQSNHQHVEATALDASTYTGTSLLQSAIPTAATAATLIAAFMIGAATGLPRGGLLGTAVALMALAATGPYLWGVGMLSALIDGSIAPADSRAINSSEASASQEFREISQGARRVRVFADQYCWELGVVTALLVVASLLHGEVDLSQNGVLFGGLLGAAVIGGYAGSTITGSTRTARSVYRELSRHRRQSDGSDPVTPSVAPAREQDICDAGRTGALRGWTAPIALCLLIPLAYSAYLHAAWQGTSLVPQSGLVVLGATSASLGFLIASVAQSLQALLLGSGRQLASDQTRKAADRVFIMPRLLAANLGPAADLVPRAMIVICVTIFPPVF